MARYLLLARDRATADALRHVLTLVAPVDAGEVEELILDKYARPRHYDYYCRRLTAVLAEAHDRLEHHVTVLVDPISLHLLNPLNSNRESLLALLILTFPECEWVFGHAQVDEPTWPARAPKEITGRLGSWVEGWRAQAGFEVLFRPRHPPLYDPTGLRNWIRALTKFKADNNDLSTDYLPLRLLRAAAIDDEASYAWFNGYVAYRFGLRANVVTRRLQLADLFGFKPEKGPIKVFPVTKKTNETFTLSFEDVFLNFPDREQDDPSLSILRDRDLAFFGLKNLSHRIFVSAGHSQGDRFQRREDNVAQIRLHNGRNGCSAKPLGKPMSGLFKLWTESRAGPTAELLDATWRRNGGDPCGDKVWPYAWPPATRTTEEATGHSAPGRLLMVAEMLILRAEALLSDGPSGPDAVQGAVLAGDALELLGDRAPGTSLTALALKHQFEAAAETRFFGVEYGLEVKERLRDVSVEVDSIGHWFDENRRVSARLNAQLSIVRTLQLVFRDANLFDEEQECLIEARDLYRQLWIHRHETARGKDGKEKPRGLWYRRLWTWPLSRAWWYLNWLLASLKNFGLSMGGWIVVLFVLFRVSIIDDVADGLGRLRDAAFAVLTGLVGIDPHWDLAWMSAKKALAVFISTQPIDSAPSLLTVFAMVIAFLHLGVFISHLYSMISRK